MISGDRAVASGKQAAFFNTLSELHKHFDRIDVICPRVTPHRYDMVVFGNVHVHPSPFPVLFQPFWIWYKGRHLMREYGHALMTVHSYPPFYNDKGAWFLSRSVSIPFVTEVLHVVGYPRAANLKELLYRWLTRLILPFYARRAAAVRVMNEHEAPQFLRSSGIPRDRMRTLPAVYIDFDAFRPREEERREFDLVFVGRLATNKGLKRFLKIVERTDRSALIVGEGPLKEWAMRRARRRRLSVTFHGFARDAHEVGRLINRARLLLMLSDNEGGPRVVPEALACGTPVLATPVGIVTDLLPPEAIESWDVKALADKVDNILSDSALYSRLREAGLHAVQGMDKKTVVTKYADALKGLVS